MNETWINYSTLESIQQTTEWSVAGESHPKRPKMQISISKVSTSLLWVAPGINEPQKGGSIDSEYYIILLGHLKEEIAQKQSPIKNKMCSFTETMHHFTSRFQRLQNYMNYTSNFFCTYSILHIWYQSTTDSLMTSKQCSRERYLAPTKKWYRKLRCILGQRQTVLQNRHRIVTEELESVHHPRKRLCWWIKEVPVV